MPFLTIDLPPLLTATLCALSCALLGNFLVLRRQALVGDAISHAVLPGLVAGFLISGSRDSLPMFAGALVAGVVTAVLIELVRRLARVEPGAAMGVVFSAMFALGVVLVSTDAARRVDLDADCVLHGQLEDIGWRADPATGAAAPRTLADLVDRATLAATPRELRTAAAVALVVVLAIGLFYKELRLASFDAELATALGFNAAAINIGLMVLVAAATVASFEAVGSILVVAMLICPAATARLMTDRLGPQIALSAGIALATGVGGYLAGALLPLWLGAEDSLSVAGAMTVLAGALLAAAVFLAPTHGIVARRLHLLRLRTAVAREDLLAMLYRVEERRARSLRGGEAVRALGGGLAPRLALRAAERADLVTVATTGLALSPTGREAARGLVRTHRLWEVYLATELGLRPDHVHRTAEALEHHTTPGMHQTLERSGAERDPHGSVLP